MDQIIPSSVRWSAHITGNCFVSFVSDNPLGSSPMRIASTMSGARSGGRRQDLGTLHQVSGQRSQPPSGEHPARRVGEVQPRPRLGDPISGPCDTPGTEGEGVRSEDLQRVAGPDSNSGELCGVQRRRERACQTDALNRSQGTTGLEGCEEDRLLLRARLLGLRATEDEFGRLD